MQIEFYPGTQEAIVGRNVISTNALTNVQKERRMNDDEILNYRQQPDEFQKYRNESFSSTINFQYMN